MTGPTITKNAVAQVSALEARVSKLENAVVLINLAMYGLPNFPNPNPDVPPLVPGYSISSPHWPHARFQWTDFGMHYRAGYPTDPTILADAALKASRMDSIMGGAPVGTGDPLWNPCTANPTIYFGPYVLILFCTIADAASHNPGVAWGGSSTNPALSHATAYANAHGFDPEDLFLHYYDGQTKFGTAKAVKAITVLSPATLTVTAHGFTTGDRIELTQHDSLPNAGTSNKSLVGQTGGILDGNYTVTVIDANTISLNTVATALKANTGTTWGNISKVLGDGTKTFANRKSSTDAFGSHWFNNWNASQTAAYHLFRLAPFFAQGQYVFADVSDSTVNVGFNAPLNPPISSLEYPCRGLSLAQTNAVIAGWQAQFATIIGTIRAGCGGKRIQANVAAYNFPADREMGRVCGAVQCEETLNSEAYGNTHTAWVFYEACLGDGTMVVAVDSVFWSNPLDIPPGDGVPFGTDAHLYPPAVNGAAKARWKVMTYIQYLLAMPMTTAGQALYYLDNNNGRWDQPQASWWLKMCEVLIGHPTETRIVSTIAANNGLGGIDKLVYRHFDNGLIVCRFRENTAWSDRDVDTATWTLPTDASYYFVHDTGVVDTTPSLTVDLNRGEAAMFVKTP